jgi:hypothetical protein
MNSESAVPNDRVRAFALWEGWHGYDRKKYKAMLREAFHPFELSIEEPAPLAGGWPGDSFPSFSARITITRGVPQVRFLNLGLGVAVAAIRKP